MSNHANPDHFIHLATRLIEDDVLHALLGELSGDELARLSQIIKVAAGALVEHCAALDAITVALVVEEQHRVAPLM